MFTYLQFRFFNRLFISIDLFYFITRENRSTILVQNDMRIVLVRSEAWVLAIKNDIDYKLHTFTTKNCTIVVKLGSGNYVKTVSFSI